MTQLPALLALWLAAPAAFSGELSGFGGERLHISGDIARREGRVSHVSYEGKAVLRSESVLLRADTLTYDETAQRVEARGHAMLVAGEIVALADALVLDIPAEQLTVTEGLVLQKRNVSLASLREAKTPKELLELGENALALRGAQIQRVGPGRFRVKAVSLVPCDCDPKAPAWRIRAAEAEVVAGESATLRGWQVLVGDVPVLPPFPMPWLEVPLSKRRSGLLFPGVTFSGPSGFGLEQPIYWALHPSYDITFTPGYFFGAGKAEDVNPDGTPTSPTGIRGPRLLTELRYAPVVGLSGRASLGLVYDFRLLRPPATVALDSALKRGLRGSFSLHHEQDLGRGFGLRANVGVVSDGRYVYDQSADVLGREAEYTRSTVVLSHHGEHHSFGVDAVLRQDTRTAHRFFEPNPGAQGSPAPLHRLPGLVLSLPERHLLGPLFGSLHLSFARLAPFSGEGGDEGTNGFAALEDVEPEPTQWNGIFDPGERERRSRLDILPRLTASLPLADVLQMTSSVAWRQTASLGEVTRTTQSRGYPLLQATGETRLAQTFGRTGLTHVLTPRLQGVWVPFVIGDQPALYEAVDIPFGTGRGRVEQPKQLFHAVAELRQRLLSRGRGEVLRLDVGQGLDLLPGGHLESIRLAEAYARLSGRLGAFSGSARVWLDPLARQLKQSSLDASLDFGRVAGVSVAFSDFVADGSERMRRGIDALVGLPAPPVLGSVTDSALEPERTQQLSLRGRWLPPFRGLGLTADVLLEPTYTVQKRRYPLAASTLGLSFAPAPDCWRVELAGGVTRNLEPEGNAVRVKLQPSFHFNLTIANYGAFGI